MTEQTPWMYDSAIAPEQLAMEEDIVWVIPRAFLPKTLYEWFAPLRTRREPPECPSDDVLAGYAVLHPNAPPDAEDPDEPDEPVGWSCRWFTLPPPLAPGEEPESERIRTDSVLVGIPGDINCGLAGDDGPDA